MSFAEGIDVGDDKHFPSKREVSLFVGDDNPMVNWDIYFYLLLLLAFSHLG